MPTSTIKTRILHKHDIEANWLLKEDFIPLDGELIIYDIDENHSYPRTKIGDGKTKISDLPFTAPDEKDAVAILAEMEFIEPVANSDGSVFTDKDGNVYTL